jgi:hypothetical protein
MCPHKFSLEPKTEVDDTKRYDYLKRDIVIKVYSCQWISSHIKTVGMRAFRPVFALSSLYVCKDAARRPSPSTE